MLADYSMAKKRQQWSTIDFGLKEEKEQKNAFEICSC
jgi:hypothetical protein